LSGNSANSGGGKARRIPTSTSATLNTITIGLIAWAVAISVAVAVMATLIVRRMRVLRARAQRLAAKRQRADVLPYDAELDTDSRRQPTSVVDLDLGDSRRAPSLSTRTVEPRPQEA